MTTVQQSERSEDRLRLVIVNHTDKVRPEVDMLTRGLPRTSFEITVLLPDSARSTLTPRDGVNYRFYDAWIVPNVRYTVPHPSFQRILTEELADASVLHILGYIYLPCLIAGATARNRNVGTVLTVDAFPGVSWTYGNRFVDLVAKLYTHTLGRATLSFPDRVVGIGEYLRADLRRFTPTNVDIEIISNGVDIEQFRPQTREVRSRDGESAGNSSTELLYVGRLDTVKGVSYLLEAVAELEDAGYHLTIVGDGSRREDYEELTTVLGIADRVSFEGYQSDVHEYYVNSDVFVLPSLSEGLPTVLIEAQASGLPVVSTDVGGASEIVRGGRIVPSADPAALRSAIEEVANSDLAQRGQVAREHVVQNYSLDRMAQSYAQLYRQLAARKQPA